VLTEKQVTEEFTRELKELLAKYGADIEASDHYEGYPECGEDIRITVEIPSIYTTDNEMIREYTTIDFGNYITADK
jgi:hypothetical protein